jgi:quinol monooxygenase YgiN
MLVVHIQVHVRPECVDAFKQATLANARASLQEPGVVRFDVVQQQDDPTRFVFVEVYRDAAAAGAQGNGALSDLARRGRADDGRATPEREV